MERRRVVEEPDQRELPLPTPRRRVAIDDGTEVVHLRVPQEVANVLATKTDGQIEQALREQVQQLKVDPEGFLGYTQWKHIEAPPSSGFWEVKQKSAREPNPARWWYDAVRMSWRNTLAEPGAGLEIPMTTFRNSHEWRGLAVTWPGGYTYTLTRAGDEGPAILPPGAALDLNPRKGMPGITAIPVARRRVEL